MLQLEHRIVNQRIKLVVVENFKEPHAANAFTEEAAQHAILGPNMPVVGRDMLHDVVGRGAQDVFGAIRLLFRDAGRPDVFFEEIDGFGGLLHQRRERDARQRNAQTAKQQQQRPGRTQDRISVRCHQFVDPKGPHRLRDGRLRDRSSRCRNPFFRGGCRRCRPVSLWLRLIRRGRRGRCLHHRARSARQRLRRWGSGWPER